MDKIFNVPMLDYLTITSYRDWLAGYATQIMSDSGNIEPAKVICYEGLRGEVGSGGSIFFGIGEQQGKQHQMVTLSSDVADRHGASMIGACDLKKGVDNCSRIDAQITIAKRIDLKSLALILKENSSATLMLYSTLRGKRIGDTIYIGSPKSDKRIRIYHKWGGTRFEVQYRRDYATSLAKSLQNGIMRHVLASALSSELLTIGEDLIRPFSDAIWGWLEPGHVADIKSNGRAQGDTERWIRTTVMTVLERECATNELLRREIIGRLSGVDWTTGELK